MIFEKNTCCTIGVPAKNVGGEDVEQGWIQDFQIEGAQKSMPCVRSAHRSVKHEVPLRSGSKAHLGAMEALAI